MNIPLIIDSWQTPGFHLIISDPEQSSLFWFLVRQKLGCVVLPFPSQAAEFASWSAQLSQSFLGAAEVYWCVIPPAGGKSSKMRQQAVQFLKNYMGPHTVWTLIADEHAGDFAGCRRISVPAVVAGSAAEKVAASIGMDRSSAVVRALGLVPAHLDLTLDALVGLLWHAGYVPMRSQEDSISFLSTLLPHEVTLTQLAESFFKGDRQSFLKKWHELRESYGDMFWISFWTEQLWRAYWVRWYMKRGQQTRARSMSYRLPASFMNGGWQQVSTQKLFLQYQIVSFFDTGVKKGSFFTMDEVVVFLIELC